MNDDSTHVMRRPRRAWPSAARTAAAIIAAATLVLLAAACSGSPSSTASGGSSTATRGLLAFAQCMRSNHVPNFPDPQAGSGDKFPSAQQLGVSDSVYQTAMNTCNHLLPAGVNDEFPPAEVQVLLVSMRRFSQCMRSHGMLGFPDPSTDSQGRPVFVLSGAVRNEFDATGKSAGNKLSACMYLLPAALGGVPMG